jgi:hypothetical protein
LENEKAESCLDVSLSRVTAVRFNSSCSVHVVLLSSYVGFFLWLFLDSGHPAGLIIAVPLVASALCLLRGRDLPKLRSLDRERQFSSILYTNAYRHKLIVLGDDGELSEPLSELETGNSIIYYWFTASPEQATNTLKRLSAPTLILLLGFLMMLVSRAYLFACAVFVPLAVAVILALMLRSDIRQAQARHMVKSKIVLRQR